MPRNPSGRGVQPRQAMQPTDNSAGLGGGTHFIAIVQGRPALQKNSDLNGSSNSRNSSRARIDSAKRIASQRDK